MNKTIATLLIIGCAITAPIQADDAEPQKTINIQQRLRQADAEIALKQYERVKMELFETSLQLDLIDGDEKTAKREELARKRAVLSTHLERIRAELEGHVKLLAAQEEAE